MLKAHRTAAILLFATLTACSSKKQPNSATDIATTQSALFTNGGFEDDSLGTTPPTGWTVETYRNDLGGLSVVPPTTFSELNLTAGGSSVRTYVRGGTTETVVPSGLSSSTSLRIPKYGARAAVVNEHTSSYNANALRQTMTTTNADVDPADNKVHVRFAIAPVLQNPDGHSASEQPYFWVQLVNITKGNSVLFYTFNYSNQPGVPWKQDPSPPDGQKVLYTDWQAFDISPGPAQLAVGDQVEILVLAAGCSQSGHWGEVYVDAFGPSLPGLGVTATAPQQINTGSTMTYTFTYSNGGTAAATNATIVENLPTGTTFASISAPGASCTTPSAGSTGTVTCNVGTVNPAANGSFTVTVNVTAGAGSTISNGDYNIYADGVSALIGPLVTTTVTSGVTYADLAVTKTDGVAAVAWGSTTVYTMVVTNNGPASAAGATFSDPLPTNMTSMSWTCAAGSGAVCPNASGSGAISETIATFPSSGVLTYTVTGNVAAGSGSGTLVNQATVSPPGGVTDNDNTNNTAVDTDQVGTLYSLTLEKAGTGQGTVVSSPAAINCGGSCSSQSANFMETTSVVLTATASTGYTFNGWSGGGCTGSQATCTVAITGNTTVTATFAPIQWTITASAPGGNGTVSCDTPVDNGTSSTCTLTPAARAFLSALTDNGSDVLGSVSGGTYVISNATGNHTVVATFTASVSSTTLGASPGSTVYGQSVTFTATVAGVTPVGTPSGTVDFNDDGSAITGCSGVALSSGTATCTTSALTVGTQPITAVYGGDATWNGSTSSINNYVVGQASTSLALADNPSGSSLNGVAVVLTATVSVTAPGAGTATGTVAFTDNGSGITGCSAVALSGGTATCTTPAVLGAGSHTFAATYGGSDSYNGSTNSLSHTVLRVSPTVTLVSDVSPSLFGQPVTFTVTVSHALGPPTGQVTVLEGATVICGPVALSGGTANCASQTLTVGTHPLVAQYDGDSGFLPANSATLSQLVVRSTTTSSVTGDMDHSVYGQTVTFTATVEPDAPSVVTPTGTVTFRDGSTVICANVTLSAGQATCQASTLAVGWHALSARYNGSTGYAPSTSYSFTLQVDQAATTVALTPSLASSVVGQAVTLSVAVSATAPGAGTPTGTVTISDGGTPLAGCTGLALSGAAASCSTSALAAGTHQLSVSYGGETRFLASSNGPQSYTVNQASTTTTVAATAATVFGQSVTFTATVAVAAPGAGTATGTVTFRDNGSTIGTGSLSGGQATFSTSALVVGSHTITAVYGGDANFVTSTSAPSTHTVNQATTSTVLAASPQPTVFGQPLTLTATITVQAPGAGTPTGTVTFRDGSTVIGTATVQPDGTAILVVSSLSAGSHTFSASYAGDASFAAASTALDVQHTVDQAAVSVTLTPAVNPSRSGEDVTFTVAVSATPPGAGTPSGTVAITDGGSPLATVTLSGGSGTFHTAALAVGTHPLSAAYSGDSSFLTGSASLSQVVQRSNSSVGLVSSVTPSRFGQAVTWTATVSAVTPGTGTPTGTVTFLDGSTTLGTAALDGSGAANLSSSSLAVGSHTVTAQYGGDGSFNVSSGTTAQTVQAAATSVVLAALPSPAMYGQSVDLTATVTTQSPGSGTPSGTVTFRDGSTVLGTGSLSSGVATLTVPGLTAGSHALTAGYAGTTSYLSSSGGTSLTVEQGSTTVAVASSRNPSRAGRPVTFTATVTSPHATPTGTVTFKEGTTTLGSASLSSGTGSMVIRTLVKGTHAITVEYGGAADFASSTETLAGGQIVENTPPVAGSGTSLALGSAHAATASGDASRAQLDSANTVEIFAQVGWSAIEEVGDHPTVVRLGGSGGDRFVLGVTPDRLSLEVTTGGSTTAVPAALSDGGWHHLALVSGDDQTTVVVDGLAVGEITGVFGSVAAEALILGEGFIGELDELRLWSAARNLDELAANARRPLPGNEAGLLGLWRLDEGSGTELFDAGPALVDLTAQLASGVTAADAAFSSSGAWRAREVSQERSMAPIDAGYDADGDALTLTLVTAPTHGAATLDATNLQVNYLPENRYLGTDRLTFALSDGTDQSSYTVDITVKRILVCSSNADCGGGDLCVQNTCTAPADITARSGGGCNTGGGAGGGTSMLALFAALLALRLTSRRRQLSFSRTWTVVALFGLGGVARAQVPHGFALQTFEPAPAGDRFFTVPGAEVNGHLRPAAGLVFSWASDPLILRVDGQPVPGGKIVNSQLWGWALGSLALYDRVVVDLAVPVALSQGGDRPFPDLAKVTGTAIGDLRFGARMALGAAGPVHFATGLNFWIPAGSTSAFASDGKARGTVQLISGGEIPGLSAEWGAQVGLLVRAASDRVITSTGKALAFSAGAAWHSSTWRIGPELYGRYQFEGTATSPVEALLGGSWTVQPFDLGLAVGTAFNDAPGAAPLRVLARAVWRPEASRPTASPEPVIEAKPQPVEPPPPPPAPEPAAPPPPPPPPPPPDRDGDGIPDDQDACPDQPGVRSDTPSRNGCPPLAVVTKEKIEISEQIQFENNSNRIRPASEAVLDAVASLLSTHPEITHVYIEGHTDNRGSAEYNRQLSLERAVAVKAWLVNKGQIDGKRLEAQGLGASSPIDSNDSAAGRATNRRVEFRVAP